MAGCFQTERANYFSLSELVLPSTKDWFVLRSMVSNLKYDSCI